MQESTVRKVKRAIPYVAGGVLIFLGVMGLLIEFSKVMPSSTNFYGYVLWVVLIVSGILICIAAWSHYGGGLWSFFGLMFIAETIGHLTFLAQVYMQHRHLTSPVSFFSTTAAFWGVGSYCLVWGHMRHHQKKVKPPNKSLQTTAAAPTSCD